MLSNKFKKGTLALAVAICTSFATPVMAKTQGKTGDILALGSDLTISQKNKLLEYFKAPENTETIYVTNEIIISQLGLDPNNQANYQGGCYSSAYVQLLNDDKGINVEASNLTEVTDNMLMNALITSGIINADVKVSAPFPVTGTSALAGILEGVENIGGYEISLKQKETAQKEIETTMDVAEEVGQDEASSLINDIKTEVIKEQPKNEQQIQQIVDEITNQYNVNISIDARNAIVNLMNDVNGLDLDYSELKDTLNQASDKFKEVFNDLGIKLKDEGFFDKIKSWISDLWNALVNLISNNSNESSDINEDKVNSLDENEEVMPSSEILNEENPMEEGQVTEEAAEINENENVITEDEDNSSINVENNNEETTNEVETTTN